ncbi:ATP-binding protein [Fundidesulfovibrio butyratiphilus]
MDRSAPGTQRTLLPLAALALILLGVSLSAVTWRNVSQQRELLDQHVLFSARTVLRGVEANLLRIMPMLGGVSGGEGCARVAEYLRQSAQSGEVLYLGLYDDRGVPVATSLPEGQNAPQPLDHAAMGDLAVSGEWYGALPVGGTAILGYAAEVQPGLDRYCAGATDAQGVHPPRYFLVGLSLDEHYALYKNFKRAALMQSGFALAVAAFVWLLLLAYLRRREQGGRLKRLEYFQSRLLDAMPEALVTLGPQGQVTAANPAARAILGADPSAHPALAGLSRTPASDLPQGWRQVEYEGKCLEVLAVPLENETLALVRDRTELRGLERSLEQTRQLAAIGRLAAGVAHEIRNPLSALRGFAQFFAGRLKGREPDETYAQTMVREADRLNRVVTDLVSLAKPRALSPAPVDLAALAADLHGLLSFDFDTAKALWRTDLACPVLAADPDALRQALVNLVLNALAALPGTGGTLTLSSRETPEGVSLTLSDDGRGMTAEERDHALEPFFTTRKDGYGLGLSLVHKTARDHGAELSIDSAPGRGTAVTLLFPQLPPSQESRP